MTSPVAYFKFNICGFAAFQPWPEYFVLLDEALSLTDDLNKQIDTIIDLSVTGLQAVPALSKTRLGCVIN